MKKNLLYTGLVKNSRPGFASYILDSKNINFVCLIISQPKLLNNYLIQLDSIFNCTSPDNNFLINVLPETPPKDIENSIKDKRNQERLNLFINLNKYSLDEKFCLIATPESLFGLIPSKQSLNRDKLILKAGGKYSFPDIVNTIKNNLNYKIEVCCESIGEFSIRGGVIDIFALGQKYPIRIDFFGDEIESLKTYDPSTQHNLKEINELHIPENLNVIDSYNSILEYLPEKPMLWLLDDPNLLERDHSYRLSENNAQNDTQNLPSIIKKREEYGDTIIGITEFDFDPKIMSGAERINVNSGNIESVNSSNEMNSNTELIDDDPSINSPILKNTKKRIRNLFSLFKQRFPPLLLCTTSDRNKALGLDTINLIQELEDVNIKILNIDSINGNYILPCTKISNLEKGMLILAEEDILGRKSHKYTEQKKSSDKSQVINLLDFSKLVEGDLLIHLMHGLCRYKTVTQLEISGILNEVITIEFDDHVLIHVPIKESHLLTRYVSMTKRNTKLAKIGSKSWTKTRIKAQRATIDYASKILRMNAERSTLEGFSFPKDHPWQKIFEKNFQFTETKDQISAIDETKKDMESTKPMDRLICGDVGYGKTEVAIRAAFKAVISGKQVAFLVPTTILCQQHLITFIKRFKEFPVSIKSLSSFNSENKNKKHLAELADGNLDLVIGTHRLLSNDVKFNNLGLLIVDEEQRFGVKQKEKIKALSKNVDILTLTATPIPRTLHLAMSGARSISIIDTPPQERIPIQTVVKNYDSNLINKAIRKEINRRGQVFYLHNRIETINSVANRLKENMPDLRIEIGHGQMTEGRLQDIMLRFMNKEFDILVCTTIIESGIDIPNCNTLIIEGADRFGLSQLYQIRGRVGRFNKQAYAYLFLHRHGAIVEKAHKRLSTLKNYNELGAGFKIAMRDLELRGAGNILGAEQSGHIANIGFELYCKLLKSSIDKLKNKNNEDQIFTELELDFITYGIEKPSDSIKIQKCKKVIDNENNDKEFIYAYIPNSFIKNASHRIHFHRSLSLCKNEFDLHALEVQMTERFGKIPKSTQILFNIHLIRIEGQKRNIISIKVKDDKLICLINKKDQKFYKYGSRFPRLTQKTAKLKLIEIYKIIKEIKQ